MALNYTVNWIEQGRSPSEEEYTDTRDVIETEHRAVWINSYNAAGQINGKILYRQSRSREGNMTISGKKIFAEIEYKAETTTANAVTTSMTQAQAAEIVAYVYANETGLVTASASRVSGPCFSVTKTVRDSTPLSTSGSATTDWGAWGEWQPATPSPPSS